MAITKANTKIDKSVQEMNNLSFDTDRNVLAREQLTVNPVSGTSEVVTAIQGNPSLSITESTVGDVTTVTVVKTIGSTAYTKTVAKNNVTNALSVSVWT